MNNSILVAFNDSISSRAVVDFLSKVCLSHDDSMITLLHLFRKPSASEELMGKKYPGERRERMTKALESAKENLIDGGFQPENIKIEIVTESYPTIADGIIDQCKKNNVDIVVIGRKRMSKAEEFVMGDVSVKLIRALEGVAVLVIKSQ